MRLLLILVLVCLFTLVAAVRLRGPSHKQELRQIFNKGHPIPGKNPSMYRKDAYGNTLKFSDHGKNVPTGWHKHHVIAKNKGGSDDVSNLEPLQASKNMSIGDRTEGARSLKDK